MTTQNNSDNERTGTEEVEQLTGQEYQWCVSHLQEATRRLDRVIELVEGTDAENRNPRNGDSDLRDARVRAGSALVHLQQRVTPEETGDE